MVLIYHKNKILEPADKISGGRDSYLGLDRLGVGDMVSHGEGLGDRLQCGGSHRVGYGGHPLNHFLKIITVSKSHQGGGLDSPFMISGRSCVSAVIVVRPWWR